MQFDINPILEDLAERITAKLRDGSASKSGSRLLSRPACRSLWFFAPIPAAKTSF
jgi:hypothetical protein